MRREDLLGLYERELLYLRRAGEGFARAFPKVARRLALGPDEAGDPHVERLIEAFAFLTSRLQLDIERQFPRLTDALLEILYPHLLAPIPSCGIARFQADLDSGKLTDGFIMPRGTTLTASANEVRCRFATAWDVELWPVVIERTRVQQDDLTVFSDGAVAGTLRLDVSTASEALEQLPLRRLRLFINAEPSVSAAVYEALTSQVTQVAYVAEDGTATFRPGRGAVSPAGFEDNEALFPYPANGHPGYRLLQEYFAFPQKFLFVDVEVPPGALRGQQSSIVFGLTRPLPGRLQLRPDTLLAGCVPVVNLFRQICEPVRIDQRRTAYLVVPDVIRDRITEVHSIQQVVGIRGDGRRVPYAQLFSVDHALAGAAPEAFWQASRESSIRADRGGTDMWLSIADLAFDPARPAAETLMVTALCTNRGLAEEIPANAILSLEDAAPVSTISMLYKPTPPRYRGTVGETAWKLISQMALNHLSLSSGPEALKALQELLLLHALDDTTSRPQVMALRALTVRPIVHRIGADAWRGFCRGLEIGIEIDERGFVGANPLVFGEVLSRFFASYVAINSFTQLQFRSVHRGEGVWRTWPRMAGVRLVL